MEYKDDYLILSGIQHFAFCRRQWALIHIEKQWQENEHTVRGELLHKKAHDAFETEKRKNVIISRGMPVYSRSMKVSGTCDVVEFRRAEEGISLYGEKGYYQVYPVEYKKGKPKDSQIDRLQLAAQIMCLEEMFSTKIEEGAIYYGEIRHREGISMTEELRKEVRDNFGEMNKLYRRQYTPKVKLSKSCNACSLKEICLPALGKTKKVREYVQRKIGEDSL